jgi:YD repeat-containing protein
VSDGRSYAYEWSDRGELLAEATQGVDARTFAWDAAGRLVQATVFTLTTHFTYTGDGTRVAVEVEGHGTTAFIPDQGGRILVESTAATSTRYLYGHGCLGEVRDGELLYYLSDGPGYVRQAADADGVVVDAWLYTPDGGVMAGRKAR